MVNESDETKPAAKSVTYANIEAFENVSGGKRRFKDLEVPGLGTIQIRSLTSVEYIAIEAMLTRAGIAARDNKPGQQKTFIQEANIQLLLAMVCDGAKEPLFKDTDRVRNMLKGMDAGPAQHLVSGCMKHAGLDEEELEDLAKK